MTPLIETGKHIHTLLLQLTELFVAEHVTPYLSGGEEPATCRRPR
jgi:hypothetical protein